MVVVMTQVRSEQAGMAQEIYTRPYNAYVARLMGGNKVVSDHVAAVANGIATLIARNGMRYAVPMQPMATAEDA
jgi:putative spermidine/putrescine transport system ATP-binding protein